VEENDMTPGMRLVIRLLVLLSLLMMVDTVLARRWRSFGNGRERFWSIDRICQDGIEITHARVLWLSLANNEILPFEDYPDSLPQFTVPLYLLQNPAIGRDGNRQILVFAEDNQFISNVTISPRLHSSPIAVLFGFSTLMYDTIRIPWNIPLDTRFTHFTVIDGQPSNIPTQGEGELNAETAGIFRIPEDVEKCRLFGEGSKPPPVPNVRDWNFRGDESPIRTHIPHHLADQVFVRPLVTDGSYGSEFGATHSGNIGNSSVLNHTILQAVDVFAQGKIEAFDGDVVICLKGLGEMLFLPDNMLGDANNNPPYQPITAWMTLHFPGYTCATLYEPGTLVLIEGEEPTIMADP
jgi:hypothetical protein